MICQVAPGRSATRALTAAAERKDCEPVAAAAGIFRDRITALGIPARVDIVDGTHTWPYWEKAIATARPMILDALGAH